MIKKWWYQWQGMLLLHALFFGILFAPFLGGSRLVAGDSDAELFHYPVMNLLAERLFSWDILWNDLNFHGFPTFLGQAYPLHPFLGLFATFMTFVTALNWTIMLYPLLGAFFFSLLMRKENISFFGSFLAGVAYAVALRSWFFDITITGLLPLFPLLLLAIRSITQKPQSALFGGAGIIALAWLMLHFHFTLILLTGSGLFTIAHAVRQKEKWLSVILIFTGMVLLGTTIGSIRILPTLAYGLLSFRTEMPLSYIADRGMGTRYPLLYLFPHFPFPFLSGGADFSPYIGPLILACTLVGIMYHWRTRSVRFLLGIYLVTFLLAIRNSPLYALLYHIPPFNFLRSPTRWPLLGSFAVATLAGIGFDTLVTQNAKRSRHMFSWFCLGLGTTAAIGGTVATLFPTIITYMPSSANILLNSISFAGFASDGYTGEYIAKVIATNYGIQTSQLALPTIALLIAGFFLHPYIWNKIPEQKRPRIVTLSSVFVLLLVIFPMQLFYSKSAATFSVPTEIQQFLKKETGYSFSFLPSTALRSLLQTGEYKATLAELSRAQFSFLPANQNLFHLLPSADYYDRLGSKRMGRLLALVGTDRPSVAPEEILAYAPLSIEEKMEELRNRKYILDMLNIHNIISSFPLETVGFEKVFTEEVTNGNIPISVYRNPSPRPFAYFARTAEFMEPDQEKAYQRLKNRTWGAEEALIECHECVGAQSFTAHGTINVMERRPIFLQVRTSSSTKQQLVLSQNYLPGWHVSVDGKTTEPGLAMSTFFAIPLASGEHTITLTFSLLALLQDSWSLVIERNTHIWL